MPHDREEYIQEINKYKATIQRIKDHLPYEIRMNMFLIDCYELKNALIQKCEELICRVLEAVSKIIINLGSNITKRCSSNSEELSKPINTAAELVKIEDFLERCKEVEKAQITHDYLEVIEWLMTLYEHPCHRVSEDEQKIVTEAHSQTNKIDKLIESSEQKLKEKRTEQEEKIAQQRSKFKDTLEEIKKDVDDFKERDDVSQRVENNKDIAEINKKLAFAETEKVDINQQEEIVGFDPTEFDQVAELQKRIKPFDELWSLYLEYYEKTSDWKKGSF